jgi:hypothetical protein
MYRNKPNYQVGYQREKPKIFSIQSRNYEEVRAVLQQRSQAIAQSAIVSIKLEHIIESICYSKSRQRLAVPCTLPLGGECV